MIDFTRLEILSFDCYGTLIDWESGILAALLPVLTRHGIEISQSDALERYARAESSVEAAGYASYRSVLQRTMQRIATELGITLAGGEEDAFVAALPRWEPFPDTVEALRALGERYALAVISNVDEDLFRATERRLGVEFRHVVTAESVRAYKPAAAMFEAAFARFGVAKERWLHVGCSRYHDIAPAQALGLQTVWVERPSPRGGTGAAPPHPATADLEVPTLADLARHALR